MSAPVIGIYPGSFDPLTFGHLDIITRALNVVDQLIVAVAVNSSKDPAFTLEERILMAKEEISHLNLNEERVRIASFEGLLVEYAKSINSKLIIRGLRAISDFEYEFQMSCMNTHLAPDIQTIFLPASERTHFISSRLIKEIARLGGEVSEFVSANVKTKLIQRLKDRSK